MSYDFSGFQKNLTNYNTFLYLNKNKICEFDKEKNICWVLDFTKVNKRVKKFIYLSALRLNLCVYNISCKKEMCELGLI